MADVNVLKEILDWSGDRPMWQRDALRRLVTAGELSTDDINELVELCKASQGLVEKIKADPLETKHLPPHGIAVEAVRLTALTHHDGVNALAKEQTIEFGPALTVVYGANAAGKSGYTRILKRACRARGAEDILGNVVSGIAPGQPSCTIRFKVGADDKQTLWDDEQAPNIDLGRVSVFDRHCASVYISEQTDVAFRPLGLDLFDKLSNACEAVRKMLEKERRDLVAAKVVIPNIPEGTKVHDVLSSVTSLTDPDAVRKLATLSEEENAQLIAAKKKLKDLESKDVEQTSRVLSLRAKRIEALIEHADVASQVVSDEAIEELFEARDEMKNARQVAEQMRKVTFEQQPLPHTGSDLWRALWKAAENYSTAEAYPDVPFPVTEDEARCVLCQQSLGKEAVERFRQFHEFLTSAVQRDRDKAVSRFRKEHKRFEELVVADDATIVAIDELKLEDPELAELIGQCMTNARARIRVVLKLIDEDSPRPDDLPLVTLDIESLTALVISLKERALDVKKTGNAEAKKTLLSQIRELEARQTLGEHVDVALDAITRLKKIAAYQMCLEDTKTTWITRKSSDVTKRAVTKQLSKSFRDELKSLKFHQIEVELASAGGARGALYHKLELKRAPGVSVPSVVSEGEARCLSIAAFFAELSTASDRSSVLFDDPVSSLDHMWRRNVAARLVLEAKSRQVVVFTHDIVFLLSLMEQAEDLGVELAHQYLRKDSAGAGCCAKQLPWAAMKVKNRIGHLKDLYQEAEKQHRTGNQAAYELSGAGIYGLLREAWERAVEEVLLGGIVERYRNSVQTQQAKQLADIDDADCKTLESGMTQCSKWMTGHDQAAAENAPFPDPPELLGDIESLERWVKAIRKRR